MKSPWRLSRCLRVWWRFCLQTVKKQKKNEKGEPFSFVINDVVSAQGERVAYTNQLFFVAFFASCWQLREPDPAAAGRYATHPSNQEPWLQLHQPLYRFLTFEILSPQSLVQTGDHSGQVSNHLE